MTPELDWYVKLVTGQDREGDVINQEPFGTHTGRLDCSRSNLSTLAGQPGVDESKTILKKAIDVQVGDILVEDFRARLPQREVTASIVVDRGIQLNLKNEAIDLGCINGAGVLVVPEDEWIKVYRKPYPNPLEPDPYGWT